MTAHLSPRPGFYRIHNGREARLPCENGEYQARLSLLRPKMAGAGVEVTVFTSMHDIADGQPGAGSYCEHDILIVTPEEGENITGYPYGPKFNVVG